MNEEEVRKEAKGFLASIFPSLPTEIRLIIGFMLVFFLFFLMTYSIIYLPKFIKNFANDSAMPKTQCWNLQVIEKTIYKVNTCTGEVIILDIHQKN